jgi:hypothetical protein
VRKVESARLAAFLATLAGCGGSSSETPPPLEPLPVNVHYDRSATTLPGELGASVKPAASALPEAEPSAPPSAPAAAPTPAPAPKH